MIKYSVVQLCENVSIIISETGFATDNACLTISSVNRNDSIQVYMSRHELIEAQKLIEKFLQKS